MRPGQILRGEREKRGWTRLTMAKKLREAADTPADVPYHLEHLMTNIYRWERGASGISERYQILYCLAFRRTRLDLFGIPGIEPGEPEEEHRTPVLPASLPEGSGYVIFVLPEQASLADLLAPGMHRMEITVEYTGPTGSAAEARLSLVPKSAS